MLLRTEHRRLREVAKQERGGQEVQALLHIDLHWSVMAVDLPCLPCPGPGPSLRFEIGRKSCKASGQSRSVRTVETRARMSMRTGIRAGLVPPDEC